MDLSTDRIDDLFRFNCRGIDFDELYPNIRKVVVEQESNFDMDSVSYPITMGQTIADNRSRMRP